MLQEVHVYWPQGYVFLCGGLQHSGLWRCSSSRWAWGQIWGGGGEVNSSAPAEPVRHSGLIHHHAALLLYKKMWSEGEDMEDRGTASLLLEPKVCVFKYCICPESRFSNNSQYPMSCQNMTIMKQFLHGETYEQHSFRCVGSLWGKLRQATVYFRFYRLMLTLKLMSKILPHYSQTVNIL